MADYESLRDRNIQSEENAKTNKVRQYFDEKCKVLARAGRRQKKKPIWSPTRGEKGELEREREKMRERR